MRRLVLALMLFWIPVQLTAQDTAQTADAAVLVADQIFITQDRVLVARGNVEAFKGTTRLRADAIRYDEATGALSIDGPITLSEGADDEIVIIADAAELDSELQTGLLIGARLVLAQQLQLAAVQIDRVNGGYSQLYKTAVTSCKICEDGEAPLWQLRARRVIHDRQEQQIYFDNAFFYIKNVPVFYLPRLRLPDPTVERSTGFLFASVRTTSELGLGIKVPYFIKFGDSRDLTVTPYFSSKTKTFEFRYREAFAKGDVQFDFALTRDDLLPGETRGYFFGFGEFDVLKDFKLAFNIQTVSDRTYFKEYDYSGADRLKSEVRLSRAKRDEYVRASVINFESLRPGEDNRTLPTLVVESEYQRRLFPTSFGGEFRVDLDAHTHQRSSEEDVLGRDVARLNTGIGWLQRKTFASGVVTDASLGATLNFFNIQNDSTSPEKTTDVASYAAMAVSYPMLRREVSGAVQTLTPMAQFGWTAGERLDVPNEESTRVEFDEGNLLLLSRFPAADRRERGPQLALGMNWSRVDPKGWDANLTLGQVLRNESDDDFSETSGLSGVRSDVLIAGQISNKSGLAITARGLVGDQARFSKAEFRGDWLFRRGVVRTSYVWLDQDLKEDREEAVSEITFDGAYRVSRNWAARADFRYDTKVDRAARTAVGVTYSNECVSVDLSVRRRYISSTSVEPSTDIGFKVALQGFSASSGTERYVRSCGK